MNILRITNFELKKKMTDLGYIVKMVIYQCRELGNPVTETLAAYVA